MSDYFLCLDAESFQERLRPTLAAAWQQRNFAPCRRLAEELLPAARAYLQRYHTGEAEPLLARLAEGLPFDRACWRSLAGEMLLFAAVEIPEFPSCAETLCYLLAPEQDRRAGRPRGEFTAIEQALHGSRDVTFGAAVYRPEQSGYNDVGDVARLAAYLSAVSPQRWTVDDLRRLPDMDDEEQADELAFAREWFPVLVELYQRCQAERHVLIIETIY